MRAVSGVAQSTRSQAAGFWSRDGRSPSTAKSHSLLESRLSRDNLDENGSDNQSLKWRPVAKSMIGRSRAVRKHFSSLPFLIVAPRQSTFLLDYRMRGRPTGTTVAVEGGTTPIALNIHFEDSGVVDQAIDCGEGHRLVGKDLAPSPND
jgi:hypothetical protein